MNSAIGLIAFPVMFGFFALREPTIHFLVGSKWDPVVTLLAFFAPLGAIQAVMTTVGTIYLATGRTRLMLGWTVVAFVVTMIAFVIGLQWGIVGVAAAYTVASALLMYPGFVIPFRLIGLSFMDLMHMLWRPLASAVLMAAATGLVDAAIMRDEAASWRLMVGAPLGALTYTCLIWVLFREQATYIWQTLRGR
jgi:PST family polysaccharide transporter